MPQDIRALAFHLPQFHPIPENDRWWGEGFTEWTNVRKAKPLFPGHYQPHVPAPEVGYYDLRDPEVLVRQAALAAEHGLGGFCFYYYWFDGRTLLETPLRNMLRLGRPDFPFCLCWVNNDWKRTWTLSGEVLMAQTYGEPQYLAFIRDVAPYLADRRAVRVHGKPVLLVYSTELFPDVRRAADIWREEALRLGVGELYLVRVEALAHDIDPASIGFDAAAEFAPDWRYGGLSISERLGLPSPPHVVEYRPIVTAMLAKPAPPYVRFPCVFPSWDNTPRRGMNALLHYDASPKLFGLFLNETAAKVRERLRGEERLLFINAWNEWGEGCHLEPDERHGREWLRRCKAILG